MATAWTAAWTAARDAQEVEFLRLLDCIDNDERYEINYCLNEDGGNKMHDDKYTLIGMSDEDMWKQDESQNGDAIIAIDESGYGHMIVMLTSDNNKVREHYEYDVLPELEYLDTPPGLYYANMKIRPIYDDVEIDWDIVKPLYPIVMTGYISLIVNSYDFNRNVFSATTDKDEVVEFDPFVGEAIEQTDEQYYNQEIAPAIVGHRFIVKSLSPLPSGIVFTTYRGGRQ